MPKVFHKNIYDPNKNIQVLERFSFQTTFIPAVFHQFPYAVLEAVNADETQSSVLWLSLHVHMHIPAMECWTQNPIKVLNTTSS